MITGNIYIWDIETAINPRALELFMSKEYDPDPKLSDLDSPPKTITNLKDQAKRESRLEEWRKNQAKKLEDSMAAARAKDIDKAALRWPFGRVVAISAMHLESGEMLFSAAGDDEVSLLRAFGSKLAATTCVVLMGKTSEHFDRTFTTGRYMAHDLGVPMALKAGSRMYSGYSNLDIDWIFGRDMISLDDMAFGLGIPGKSFNAGADVPELVLAGKWDELRQHNKDDLRITREVARRWFKDFA